MLRIKLTKNSSCSPTSTVCSSAESGISGKDVPTKYKGFCARLGPCGKSRSLQGPSRKVGVTTHVFEISCLESPRKVDDSSFLQKGKDISSQIS